MGSVTRRIKRNQQELETGTRRKLRKGYAIHSERIDRRVARAEARLKDKRDRT